MLNLPFANTVCNTLKQAHVEAVGLKPDRKEVHQDDNKSYLATCGRKQNAASAMKRYLIRLLPQVS